MRVFISGVIQGSREDRDIQAQDYRTQIAEALRAQYPDVEVVDPWELFPDAVKYSPDKARQTLMKEIEMAGSCDALVAYLPQASMGTSLEMWAAYSAGAPVLTISNMTHNWVVLTLSTAVYASLEDFLEFVAVGDFGKLLDGHEPGR